MVKEKRITSPECIMLILSIILFAVTIIIFMISLQEKEDVILTNEQIMKKATVCDKKGKAIQMVYDDQWQVYAVKCVESGFPNNDGRKKSK